MFVWAKKSQKFMKKTQNEDIDEQAVEKYASKIVEGVIKLKSWSTT